MATPNPLRDYHLRLLVTHGRTDDAQALLDAYNRFSTAFGGEPFTMPEPLELGLPNLVTCPAIVEVEHLPKRDGRSRIAA